VFSIFNFQFSIPASATSQRRELARTRIFVVFLLAGASLAAALVLLSAARAVSRPRVSITPISYESWVGNKPNLYVRIAITNTGHVALIYNMVNFCDDAWLRTESARGWTNREIHPAMALPLATSVLKPGGRTTRLIRLPPDTLRWQVGYTIRAAGLRQRVLCARAYKSIRITTMPPNWLLRLYSLCGPFLPDREGPKQAVQSPVFEYPQNEPVAMNGWTPPAIGSEAAWSVVPESPSYP
jgi:hypothetical protein